jgi:hypothetical protein
MEKLYRQNESIVAKIGAALFNYISVSDKIRADYAKLVHDKLSNKKKFLFFKAHKSLPEPSSITLDMLLKIADCPMPPHIDRLRRIGITLHNLHIMAQKSTRLPQFLFSITQLETELIDKWSQNTINKESSFSPYNW